MQIVILGGGIVGLTMANLLSQAADLNIILIESKAIDFKWDPASYDIRCSAITRASQNIFKHIGIWQQIVATRVGMYNKMQVWDENTHNTLNFSAIDIAQADLGHIVENRLILRALWDTLHAKHNVTVVFGTAQKLEQHTGFSRLYVNHSYIDAQLIIGADGADSWLRNTVNIDVIQQEQKQHALVATIKTQLVHDYTARQCFTRSGAIAFLPLDQTNLSSIVWSAAPDKIAGLMQLTDSEFCKLLAQEFDNRLGELALHGERACFPLRMLHAKSYIASRIALIGDAAHIVHPIAGQGLNLGVMDAAALAEILITQAELRKDIGQQAVLRKYERWRKGNNLAVLILGQVLKTAFASPDSMLRGLCNIGLLGVERLPIVKQVMASFAMGLNSDIPICAKSSYD